MRIAVYHNLPSGGGKRALWEMVRRLSQRHIIDVYTLSTAEHNFCDLRPFVHSHKVYEFRVLPSAKSPFGRINQLIRTADLFRLEFLQRRIALDIDGVGYDVVFVHNCQISQSPGLLKFLRTPSVYYAGEPPRHIYEPIVPRPYYRVSKKQLFLNRIDPLPGFYRSILRKFDSRNVNAATAVLVNSYFTRENFYRIYGIFAHVGRLGVDLDTFHPLGVRRENYVLSVGSLQPHKGFDWIIRALGLLDFNSEPSFRIVSNYVVSEERVFLQQLADESRVDVEFFENISDEAMVEMYNRALLTVYMPVMEPFGFVPLESMACGTPVIGVAEGGVRETILHGVTGILVERDVKQLARAIRVLLDDEVRYSRYARECRAYVTKEWSWEFSKKQIETYLENAANGDSF